MKVSLDSRLIKPGDYFIPIKGENFDGHKFIQTALDNGASGILEEDELYKLATEKLLNINPKVIAITGSVGKSTMRRFLADILMFNFQICEGDLNTKLGLATNIINNMSADCEIFIAECGMDHAGELLETGSFIKPDFVLITNISESHIEKLGSLEAIKKAKSEIMIGMKPTGTVFLNWDNENIRNIQKYIPGGVKVVKYGSQADSNAKTEDLPKVEFKFIGKHNYINALGAFAVAKEFGLIDIEIENALTKVQTPKGRLAIIKGINGSVIIDDTYNSSPVSCVASIDSAVDYYNNANLSGRKIAVLGGMLELGSYEDEGHRKAGDFLAAQNFDEIVLAGELAKKMASGNLIRQTDKLHYCENSELAGKYVKDKLKPASSDLFLIKGSQGIRMEKTVFALMDDPSSAPNLLVRQDARWKT